MAAFSSAGQVRRRPAPVKTSTRRARSGIGVSSEINMCRSSQPAPNVTPHAWLRKALPRRRLQPIPAAPGQVARVDYEYCRKGTVNLFVAVEAHRSWRKVSVTERRTARDYAERLRELVDVDYPDAACIRVVQDNLSTHTPGSLYETFPAAEAHRILERLEFHYTPKYASWLNMVEIEIGVLKGQCLDRRINNQEELEREIAVWERQRNASGARVKWMFTITKARATMGRAYPKTSAILGQLANES